MSADLKPCGTLSACRRHYSRGETPCDACRAAQSAYNRARKRGAGNGSGRYVEGWRDRFCTLCGFGPSVTLATHYLLIHGATYRELGMEKAEVMSADYLAGFQAHAHDRELVLDGYGRLMTPAEQRRAALARWRRWTKVAQEEIAAGPRGLPARLGRRWRVPPVIASSRLHALRQRGFLPPAEPRLMPCGTIAAHKRHRDLGEEPCDACRAARADYEQTRPRRRRPGAIPRLPLQPCGTAAAWQRHRKRGEVPCDACRAAQATYRRERRRQVVSRLRPPPQPCGTYAAYRRHLRGGEVPCDACRAAEAAYQRDLRIRRQAAS